MAANPIPPPDDEEDDEKRRELAAQPIGKSSAIAPIGSTEDLENKAAARTIPRTAAPETGSTEDLEAKADTNNPMMKAAGPHPVTSGVASLWSKADNIHNPILRVIGKIGAAGARAADTIGSIAAPGVAAMIPGSTLNGKMNENRQRAQETEDIGNEKTQAETKNLDAQPELKQAALDMKQKTLDETGEKNANTHEAQLRKYGLKSGPDGHPTAISYEEMSPEEQAVHDLKTNQADASEAKAELDKMRGDPSSPMYQMQLKRLQVAQANAQNAGKRLNLSTEQFQNKLQEQELVKPSGQAQSRGSSAQAALDIMPDLEKEIRENAANLGPIMGRLQSGEIKIGDVDPKIAHLYSALNSFYALNPSIHGFRNYELVKDMPSIIGGLSRDPEATIAGIEGLKGTIQSVAKEGKTFHNRIVEGRDTAAPAGGQEPPRPANVPANYIFNATGPKGKGWYRP